MIYLLMLSGAGFIFWIFPSIGICIQHWFEKRVSARRLEQYSCLYPRKNARKIAWEKKKKQWKYCYGLLILGLLFGLVLGENDAETIFSSENTITRNAFQGAMKQIAIQVEDKTEGSHFELRFLLLPLAPDAQERQQLFAEGKCRLDAYFSEIISDFTHVERNIALPSELSDDLTVEWYSSKPNILSHYGKIGEEVSEWGEEVVLEGTIKYGEYSQTFEWEFKVFPLRDERTFSKRLEDCLQEQIQDTTRKDLVLPSEFEGRQLAYAQGALGQENRVLLLILFAVVLFFVYLHFEQEVDQAYEKRKEGLKQDYPELVSKLTLLLSAGLNVQTAWKKMVEDYEKANGKMRYGYEEMRRASLQMQGGAYEQAVYSEFGRRCGLHSYLRLGTLLEENSKTGVSDLLTYMHAEVTQALEERLTQAKRKGEVARTKLLFPMLLLMVIVMVIVLVPAWLVSGM